MTIETFSSQTTAGPSTSDAAVISDAAYETIFKRLISGPFKAEVRWAESLSLKLAGLHRWAPFNPFLHSSLGQVIEVYTYQYYILLIKDSTDEQML